MTSSFIGTTLVENDERSVYLSPNMDQVKDRKVQAVTLEAVVDSSWEVTWHNMKMADVTHNVAIMAAAITCWQKANQDKTLVDLDDKFREHNMQTALIAIHYNQEPQYKMHVERGIASPRMLGGEPTDYVLWISCRPPPNAQLELLQFRKSVAENRELLPKAGVMTVNEDTKHQLPKHEVFDKKQGDDYNGIADGTKRVVMKETTLGTMLKAAIADRPFELAIVDIGPEGPLKAVFVDGKIVSRVGICGNTFVSF
jgi:hypothetical protein